MKKLNLQMKNVYYKFRQLLKFITKRIINQLDFILIFFECTSVKFYLVIYFTVLTIYLIFCHLCNFEFSNTKKLSIYDV